MGLSHSLRVVLRAPTPDQRVVELVQQIFRDRSACVFNGESLTLRGQHYRLREIGGLT